MRSINRQCTLCETNDLVNQDDVNLNTISDHIMVKEDSHLETIEAKVSCIPEAKIISPKIYRYSCCK